MIKIRNTVLAVLLVVFFALFLIFVEKVKAEPKQFHVGQILVGQGSVCDKPDQWARVIVHGNENGDPAATELYKQIAVKEQTPEGLACGLVIGSIQLVKIIWEGNYLNEPSAIVEVLWVPQGSRGPHPEPMYTFMRNSLILENKRMGQLL